MNNLLAYRNLGNLRWVGLAKGFYMVPALGT